MFLAFVGTGLLAGAWYLARVRPPGTDRASRDRAPVPTAVRVSVIVPARDEARTLPRLLTSLRALEPAPYEILVVDDDSTDATASVAAAHSATVVAAGARPPGWAGKPWACQVGADTATGTHLLFLDADTWLAPDALARLLDEHAQHGGLVSVQPFHVTVRPYEELSAYCNAVAMMGTGAFTPRGATTTRAAFGPCLFTTVGDYDAVGGHASVRSEVLEDVRLSHRYRAAGLPVTCRAGREVVRFRMYPDGLHRLVEGWSKNMASGAAATDRVAVVATVVWVAAQVAVTVRAATGVTGWTFGRGPAPLVALGVYAVVAVQMRVLLRRIGSFRRLTAVVFPVPLAAFVAIFLRSCVLTFVRREVIWRDRTIAVGPRRHTRPRPPAAHG